MLVLVHSISAQVRSSSEGTEAQEKQNQPIKVIIDTDIGEDIDDILVLAFALNSPEFEVLAVTTVDGNVQARSRVARKVLALYGRPDIPVSTGYVRKMPLDDINYPGLSGGMHYGEVALEEEGLPPPSKLRADKLIAQLVNKHPNQLTLVTLGSMSNIGHFLVRYPDEAKKLKQIVTNGGEFTTNEQSIGWNLRYDPVATVMALRSEVPWVLLSEPTLLPSSLRQQDMDSLETEGLATTDLLIQAIHLWKTDKHDAAPWPHIQDLNTLVYLMGSWIETGPGTVFLDIGPRSSLPGFRVENDPTGRTLLGSQIRAGKAAALRELVMQRLCAPPRDSTAGEPGI